MRGENSFPRGMCRKNSGRSPCSSPRAELGLAEPGREAELGREPELGRAELGREPELGRAELGREAELGRVEQDETRLGRCPIPPSLQPSPLAGIFAWLMTLRRSASGSLASVEEPSLGLAGIAGR